jgi:hypothetical protein
MLKEALAPFIRYVLRLLFYLYHSLRILRLLALIVAFKKHRSNSIIKHGELKQALADEVGLSINTFREYMGMARQMKLLVPYGKHEQFISLKKIAEILFPDCHLKHIGYFNNTKYDTNKVKEIYEYLQFLFPNRNFLQQQYNINKKTIVQDAFSNGIIEKKDFAKIKKLAKTYNCTIGELPSMLKVKKNIVSGKTHCSNLVGCSVSSGSRLLKKWNGNGWIRRFVNVGIKWTQVNKATYAQMEAEPIPHFNPMTKRNGYRIFYGSNIFLYSFSK